MEVLAPGGDKVAYRVFGDGPRTLILVHGWMMSGAVFDPFLSALDTAGLRVVVPDLVGSGDSARPESGYTLARYADDVLAVLREVMSEGAPPAIVLGHSMGGQVAMLVAASARASVAQLVLLNPVPSCGVDLPEEARGLFRSCAGDAEKLGMILDMATEELSGPDRARLLAIAVDVEEACIIEAFDAWTAGGFEDRLAEISASTLVLATDDAFLPRAFLESEVVDRISGARLHYLAGPGHYPIVERAAETAAIVSDFLVT